MTADMMYVYASASLMENILWSQLFFPLTIYPHITCVESKMFEIPLQ